MVKGGGKGMAALRPNFGHSCFAGEVPESSHSFIEIIVATLRDQVGRSIDRRVLVLLFDGQG